MVQNPPKDMPRIMPYLHYNNLEKALEWLSSVFGFQVSLTLPDKHGKLMHAEVKYADGVMMLGPANPKYGSLSPLDLKGVNQGLYVYVDDVDRHYESAKAQGAVITMEPENMFWGDRMYAAKDLEGHSWTFAQHVEDIPPEQMQPPESWME
jgi:uncharacterized glyoxalase superfamily protein PhnB